MKKNIITFTQSNSYFAAQEGLVVPSSKAVPQWYRSMDSYTHGDRSYRLLPKSIHTNATAKWCVPFLDALSSGYMVTLSSDIQVVNGDNNEVNPGFPSFQWRTPVDLISGHGLGQVKGMPVEPSHYEVPFKFETNIKIKTPKGYSCLITHPLNRSDLPFKSFSGVVDTDSFPDGINIPFSLSKSFEGIIEFGTPVAQVIPFKRDEWEMEIKKYSEQEHMRDSHSVFRKIYRSYKEQFWSRKSYS